LENLIFAWNILKAALGVGFVIFLHELGHFALAKWNGVKVLRFSIGFGPPIISYRKGVGLRVGAGPRPAGPVEPPGWGETEYWLSYIPLGGYVLMFGEGGDESPAEPDAEVTTDPRAYKNKSVWARMQIITAGVIMNLILGLACFTFVYSQGMTETPAKIGGVLPGAPAYKAGHPAGDEIVAIDDRRDVGFRDLLSRVSMSGAGQKIKFTIKRPGLETERVFDIEPLRDASNQAPTIGIVSSHGLELNPALPFHATPGQDVDKARPKLDFKADDKIVAVGPEGGPLEPVQDQVGFSRKTEKFKAVPLVVEVERKKAKPDDPANLARVTVPPHRFLDFGFRLTPGPITAIRPDSPAEKAGLKEGDRIEKVDGAPDYDPMRLPDYIRDRAGTSITLAILRPVDGKATRLELSTTPDASPAWVEPSDLRLVPLDVPGLGLAMAIDSKVQAVADGSPAAKAGLKPGDVLRSMILTPAKGDDEKSKPRAVTFKLDGKIGGWPTAFITVQDVPAESIELTTEKSDKPIKITPEIDQDRFYPERGLIFQALRRKLPPLGLVEAVSRGWDETIETVVNVFFLFRGMFQGRIGGDAVGGVIPIAQVTYQMASAGWTPLIGFLGSLSVGLAVLNFLPIPPLDGGQFTILVIEKIRGRPLSEGAQNVVSIIGLVVVLGLILIVNGRDIIKLVSGYF
jgi:regulator of sigma E protease